MRLNFGFYPATGDPNWQPANSPPRPPHANRKVIVSVVGVSKLNYGKRDIAMGYYDGGCWHVLGAEEMAVEGWQEGPDPIK